MLAQPDDATCGPTCLHAVYRYLGHEIPLDQIIRKVTRLKTGGTLGVMLGVSPTGSVRELGSVRRGQSVNCNWPSKAADAVGLAIFFA